MDLLFAGNAKNCTEYGNLQCKLAARASVNVLAGSALAGCLSLSLVGALLIETL